MRLVELALDQEVFNQALVLEVRSHGRLRLSHRHLDEASAVGVLHSVLQNRKTLRHELRPNGAVDGDQGAPSTGSSSRENTSARNSENTKIILLGKMLTLPVQCTLSQGHLCVGPGFCQTRPASWACDRQPAG